MISRRAELLCLIALLLAALGLRYPTLTGTFDREYDGFQAASFTAMVINYERLGIDAYGGYGVFNVDLPTDSETTPYLYPNHPPTVILAVWKSLSWFGPDGWADAWKQDLPPPAGFETAVRLPFFLLHFLSLFAFWWAVRQAAGPLRALLALGVLVALPISILYASLVNYENAYLPWTLFAAGFHVRWLRWNRSRDLTGVAACLFLAGTITFGPAFFVATFVFHALFCVGFKRAFLEGAVASVAVLTPLALHGWWVKQALPEAPAEGVWARVSALVTPAFDGSAPIPEWIERNVSRLAHFASAPFMALAVAGFVVALALVAVGLIAKRQRLAPATDESTEPTFELGWLLFGGALLMCLSFYRHTFDGTGLYDSQTVFLINYGPGLACFAALALERLGRLGNRHAALVSLTVLVILGGLAQPRTQEVARIWRAPGPNDQPPVAGGPRMPLPTTTAMQLREVLPPRTVGLIPAELSLTPATSLYAWRTLISVTPQSFPIAIVRVRDVFGVGDLPRYLVLPVNPPPGAAASVATARTMMLEQNKTVFARSEYWEVWDFQN